MGKDENSSIYQLESFNWENTVEYVLLVCICSTLIIILSIVQELPFNYSLSSRIKDLKFCVAFKTYAMPTLPSKIAITARQKLE